MATNKRKDAAALFELIDKSTLKVPKHAGALKIPDWWSSKNNPVATPDAAKAALPDPPTSDAKSTAAKNTTASLESTAGESISQTRLFEPPPPGSVPSLSPSIRPPSTPTTPPPSQAGTQATISTAANPTPAPSPFRPTHPATQESLNAIPAADRPAGARVFAPQTMDQGNRQRQPWAGQHKRRAGWTPKWLAIVAVVCVVLAILVYSVLHFLFRSPSTLATNGTVQGSARTTEAAGGAGFPLLPPSDGRPTMPIPAPVAPDQGNDSHPPANPDAEAPAVPAKVYGPRTVTRSPELYYVVISSTPTASVAQKNADFLAAHGIDVSVEIVAGPANTRWFKIISVQGFPSMVAAEPYRKRIVLIGHLHPDFKNHKKVWDDAFVSHVTMVASK